MQISRLTSLVGGFAATTLLASSLAAQNPRQPGGRAVVPPGAVAQPATPPPTVARPVTPDPLAPCCGITALSGSMVTAVNSVSGNTFQFRVNDRAVLRTLAVGSPVWADFAAGRAGLRANVLCCAIVTGGGLAGGGRQTPPVQQPPASGVTGGRGVAGGGRAPVTTPPGRLAGGVRSIDLPQVQDRPGFVVVRRTPVEFRPFDLASLRQGGMPPGEILRIPNGKRMTAAQYLEYLNAHEQGLNDLGYSLRDPEAETVVGRPAFTPDNLRQQQVVAADLHQPVAGRIANVAQMTRNLKNIQLQAMTNANRLSMLAAINIAAFQQNQRTGIDEDCDVPPMGAEESFYVALDCDFALYGTVDGTSLEAAAEAEVAVLDFPFTLIEGTAEVQSPKGGEMTGTLEVRIFGNAFTLMDKKSLTVWEDEGELSRDFEWSEEFPFSVGPVPMSLEVGLRGEGGFTYYVGVAPASVAGRLTPFVHSAAYVELAAVDLDIGVLEIAEVGAGGEIVLINDDLTLEGIAQLQLDTAGTPYLFVDYSGTNRMETLSGRIYAYIEYWVLDWDGWHKKKKTTELWDADGIIVEGQIFEGEDDIYFTAAIR